MASRLNIALAPLQRQPDRSIDHTSHGGPRPSSPDCAGQGEGQEHKKGSPRIQYRSGDITREGQLDRAETDRAQRAESEKEGPLVSHRRDHTSSRSD
jgi:hypothetical protein